MDNDLEFYIFKNCKINKILEFRGKFEIFENKRSCLWVNFYKDLKNKNKELLSLVKFLKYGY